ncbi:hypothetical protein VIBNISOn1_90001 [Vibrio nigripulchritudo SOn1]|uniref:Transposase IS116/IS110/IS902 C-terminal domain-containing protein n=1 Tax=Vibrio nigripulchritudo SOn1 TaxID=1238450 RepID=A0AAV2VYC7_9VIBR|nr:hypothetical protein VIBNISOn1_90001 [Vibrio nigripulchritudo SOn1]
MIAMEVCWGAHWLARRCQEYGHQVKKIPLQYVKPYVKSYKNDFIDADATAACCLSSVSDPKGFLNGRNFVAWLGLVPFQYSTGGKPRMIGLSKRGNKELRELFIYAARAVLWINETAGKYFGTWLMS